MKTSDNREWQVRDDHHPFMVNVEIVAFYYGLCSKILVREAGTIVTRNTFAK